MTTAENKTSRTEREDDLFADNWRDTKRRLQEPKKKKKKVLPYLVFVLALILTSLLGVFAMAWKNGSPQLAGLKEAEQAQLDDYTAFIQSVPKPETWDEGMFESMKQSALAAYDRTRFDEIEKAEAGDQEMLDALKDQTGASQQPGLEPYKRLFENPGAYPADLLAFAAGDPALAGVILNYPEHVNDTGTDQPLSVDLNTLPDLKTFDQSWGYVPYDGSLMMITGGAPTAIAEVFSYLLKDPNITPLTIARLAAETGYEADPIPEGGMGSLFSEAALTYGVSMNPTLPYKTQITDAVQLADIVIAATGTRENPHFIVIYGIDENGNWVVNDPTSTAGPSSVDPDTIKDSLVDAFAFWVQ